jgi:hypothetical protein
MFEDLGLLTTFNISEEKLGAFTREVIKGYTDAPYHHKSHAFDVTHVSFLLLTTCEASKYLRAQDMLCLLMAALAHDTGHDGFNNDFHEKTLSDRAITYSCNAIHENYSASSLVKILQKDECNILSGIPKEEAVVLRDKTVKMILETDPTRHFDMITEFSNALENHTLTARQLATVLLHIADVSNPVRPEDIMTKWAKATQREFFVQGDKEKELGMPVSPFMDRHSVNLAKMEIKFIDYIVAPAFYAVADFLPLVNTFCIERMNANRHFWDEHVESQRTRSHSTQGLPGFTEVRKLSIETPVPGMGSTPPQRKKSLIINSEGSPGWSRRTVPAHTAPPPLVPDSPDSAESAPGFSPRQRKKSLVINSE